MNSLPKITQPLARVDRSLLMRERRRVAIMAAAVHMAHRMGWRALTREAVAAEAGVATGSINHEFGTMEALRHAVMQEAVDEGHLEIIAAGLAEGHPAARDAPPHVREAAIRAMA